MATNTAPTTSTNGKPAPSLWQAPMFLFGIAALVGVWFARPWLGGNPNLRIDRHLAEARTILKRPDGDAEYALKLAQRVLEAPALPPKKLGEASFLAGSALVRLAEKADPGRAQDTWKKAREALEQAERAGLGDDDMRRLLYRLGKAGYYTGDDRIRVIARLEQAIDQADNRAEGYALITQAYLGLKPPDLNKALEANGKLRDVVDATQAEQTAAQVIAGEINLKMGKPHDARLSLKNITEKTAPPAVVLKARLLMARSHQDEGHWVEAARLYELALSETRVPLAEPAPVQYDLGVCYRKLEQIGAAGKAWQACLKQAQGPEGPAAALSLADLRLADPAREPVLEMLALGVARVDPSAGWTNPLFDLARVREVFERSIKTMREAGQHDLAAKALESYTRVADPKRLVVLEAESKADWARSLVAPGKDPKPTDEQVEQAKKLFTQATDGFAKLAESPAAPPAERSGYLWLCAQSALAARNSEQARVCLEAFVKLNLEPARMGEAWYQLGEIYSQMKNKEQAGVAYRKCLEFPDTRTACRARYQMAMAALEANDPDEAEAALGLNVRMLRWDTDPVALPQTLLALGNLLYQRRQYSRALRSLEEMRDRFKDNPEVFRARYQLADSYRQLALQSNQNFLLGDKSMSDETRKHFEKQRSDWQEKAAEEFAALEKQLDTPEGKELLTPELRVQVPFIAAKCLLYAGKAEKALPIYEKLIARHAGKYEELEALGGAVSCYAKLEQVDKVRGKLLQINQLLPKMPEEARAPWQAWLNDAKKELQKATPQTEKVSPATGNPSSMAGTTAPRPETTTPVRTPTRDVNTFPAEKPFPGGSTGAEIP